MGECLECNVLDSHWVSDKALPYEVLASHSELCDALVGEDFGFSPGLTFNALGEFVGNLVEDLFLPPCEGFWVLEHFKS